MLHLDRSAVSQLCDLVVDLFVGHFGVPFDFLPSDSDQNFPHILVLAFHDLVLHLLIFMLWGQKIDCPSDVAFADAELLGRSPDARSATSIQGLHTASVFLHDFPVVDCHYLLPHIFGANQNGTVDKARLYPKAWNSHDDEHAIFHGYCHKIRIGLALIFSHLADSCLLGSSQRKPPAF